MELNFELSEVKIQTQIFNGIGIAPTRRFFAYLKTRNKIDGNRNKALDIKGVDMVYYYKALPI